MAEIRREQLRKAIATLDNGNQTAFAARVDVQHYAREWERRAGLPKGYFDVVADPLQPPTLQDKLNQLPPDKRTAVEKQLHGLIDMVSGQE